MFAEPAGGTEVPVSARRAAPGVVDMTVFGRTCARNSVPAFISSRTGETRGASASSGLGFAGRTPAFVPTRRVPVLGAFGPGRPTVAGADVAGREVAPVGRAVCRPRCVQCHRSRSRANEKTAKPALAPRRALTGTTWPESAGRNAGAAAAAAAGARVRAWDCRALLNASLMRLMRQSSLPVPGLRRRWCGNRFSQPA
jgi:mono/diheme cytochrome c family protein